MSMDKHTDFVSAVRETVRTHGDARGFTFVKEILA